MDKREQMLQKINEISFTVNDLTLYLDTHPTDANALTAFSYQYHAVFITIAL